MMLRSNRCVCGMCGFQVTQSQHIAQKDENCISGLIYRYKYEVAAPPF